MTTATNNENRTTPASAAVFANPELLNQVVDEIFAELPTREDPPVSSPLKPVPEKWKRAVASPRNSLFQAISQEER